MSPDSFSKRQREKDRREKAAWKAARRAERQAAAAEAADEPTATPDPVDEAATIAELERLHARFADDEISFEDFETAKAALVARLQGE